MPPRIAKGQQRRCRAAVIDISQQKRADELAAANDALRTEMAARRQAEEDLRAAKNSADQAKTVAEQANRAKDHFLAALSHELRTPLTPVAMGISMLQDRPDLARPRANTLEMVRRNVEMEARLIDDLLDVARNARGGIDLTRRPVKLCTVIQRAVEVCKPDIEARRLEFAVDLGPAPYWVEADVARLQQVFWNLLKNAVKFTPHGGRIGVRCRPQENQVLVEVSDSGIGIEPEAMPRIFRASSRPISRRPGSSAAWAWDWQSARRWWSCTAARSRPTAPAAARGRRSACGCRFLHPPRRRPPKRPRRLRRRVPRCVPCASCWSRTTASPPR